MENAALWRKCAAIQGELVKMRRALHRIPETGERLEKTSAYVISKLEQLGIPYVRSGRDSAIAAHIRGSRSGKRIILRADMDALPIREETGASYASEHDGFMHACGHDVHMTVVLMAAELLAEKKDSLKGNVKFVFQPAEETTGGALPMIQEGILENPHADCCVGLHVRPELEYGKIICAPGPLMASPDNFYVTFKGKGGHCATPEQNDDLIAVGLQFKERLSKLKYPKSVVTLCSFQAGDAPNVMPSEIRLSGSFRTFNGDMRCKIASEIREIAENVAGHFGITQRTEIEFLYPPLINDAKLVKKMQTAAEKVIGEKQVIKTFEPSMLGEDFSYFGQYVPSVYFYLGTNLPNPPTSLHADNFDVDERAIEIGAKILAEFVTDYLK